MATVSIQELQAKLPDLITDLREGDDLIITNDGRPVARLQAVQNPQPTPRTPGRARGLLKIQVDDDEHLQDFKEHM